MQTLKRCDVVQMGEVIPHATAENQPPLLYITRVDGDVVEGVTEGRKRVTLSLSLVMTYGYRGNVTDKDLAKIERKAK